ncbi:MAG TPA: mechanosensitive ion channel family protein [Candidatus Avacidaminococcus intestinavium]|uniref:Mechanosensitive ion channel family protein n=1 Tax=Candidatus Avacidaminococcus intestinavium TaxID=2840684 RepID=A0A9D1MPA7_9FIRM|nr:mechanosensitive ion channel family protein [Candidatus Avacidaminococcus intestinavium]
MQIFEPWLMPLAILASFFLFKLILRPLIRKLLMLFAAKLSASSVQGILDASKAPADFILAVLAFFFALMVSPLESMTNHILMKHLIRSCVIISIFWTFFNLVSSTHDIFLKVLSSFAIRLDAVLSNIISTFLQFFILAVGFAMIVSEWGYDINGFIAGLSLGGLAVSLAAKDALANVFGSIIILMDKPFVIGDWIETLGVEGTVEKISLRSTSIRTYPEALVYLPNSLLANTLIANYSRRSKRRIEFTLSIADSTPSEKLEHALADIRSYITEHPRIYSNNFNVNFDAFGEKSLNIYIFCYSKTTVYLEFLKIKEELNFALLEIMTKHQIASSSTSTNIYFNNPAAPGTSKQQ